MNIFWEYCLNHWATRRSPWFYFLNKKSFHLSPYPLLPPKVVGDTIVSQIRTTSVASNCSPCLWSSPLILLPTPVTTITGTHFLYTTANGICDLWSHHSLGYNSSMDFPCLGLPYSGLQISSPFGSSCLPFVTPDWATFLFNHHSRLLESLNKPHIFHLSPLHLHSHFVQLCHTSWFIYLFI